MTIPLINQEYFNDDSNPQVSYKELVSQLKHFKKENSNLMLQQNKFSKLKEENTNLVNEIAFLKQKIDYNKESKEKLNEIDMLTFNQQC